MYTPLYINPFVVSTSQSTLVKYVYNSSIPIDPWQSGPPRSAPLHIKALRCYWAFHF